MNLEEQIAELKKEIAEKDIYERKLKEAEAEYQKVLEEERKLANVLKKEKRDVERLESLSLFRIWCAMTGKVKERLAKEKTELSHAEYNYRIVRTTLADLKEEIEDLECKLLRIKNSEAFLEGLLQQKEEVFQEEDALAKRQAELKELQEASGAGNDLLVGLRNVLLNLEKAGKLRDAEGGCLCDLIKDNHIDAAKRNLEDLQYLIGRFNRELNDARRFFEINVESDGLLAFSEWLAAGFFEEVFLRHRMDVARDKLEKQVKVLEGLLAELASRQEACRKALSEGG
ncbi:MAG TPA: hypothetical protein GYA05_02160 [Acholeplasmataceae bacterium]|nr:hypothetical protein [Acholeplasmataceae bacterium]